MSLLRYLYPKSSTKRKILEIKREQEVTNEQNELLLRIDEVLHYVWDPIGVRNEPAARHEYSSYATHVLSMLMKGASEKEIIEYLRHIRVASMEVGRPEDSNEDDVAELLVRWKETIG